MIRQSASLAKRDGRSRFRRATPEGVTAAFYQFLRERKGLAVAVPQDVRGNRQPHKLAAYLNDFYGCDIRKIKCGLWCLCGEFTPRGTYVDYIARNQRKGDA